MYRLLTFLIVCFFSAPTWSQSDTSKVNDIISHVDSSYRSSPSDCLSKLDSAITLAIENSNHRLGKLYQVKCACELVMENAVEAENSCTKALEIIGTDTLRKEYIASMANLGVVKEMQGDYDEALYYYGKVMDYLVSKKDTLRQASTLNNMGLVYEAKGQLAKAKESYLRSNEMFREKGHRYGYKATLTNLGKVSGDNKDYVTAIRYFNQSINVAKELNDKYGESVCLANIATMYQDRPDRNLDSAVMYFEKAMKINDEIGYKRGMATCLNNLSKIKNIKNEPKEALELAKKGLPIAIENKDLQTELYTMVEIGRANSLLGNHREAIRYLKVANERADNMGMVPLQSEARGVLSKAYEEVNPTLALKTYKQAITFRDSLINRKQVAELAKLESDYQYKGEISQLNADKRIAEAELKSSQQRNIGLGLGLGLLGLLSLMLYRQREQIQNKNQIITKALDEKDTLLREIHHRVKNNLQFISSLLNLQSRNVQDQSALSALQDGQNRVKSMALIHQNLYQEDNLTGVEVKDYFEKLTQSIFSSYNISSDRVTLEMDVEALNLDVDTVIPLGLIVNELVTNALKHAFADGGGIIKLTLREESDDTLLLSVADDGVGISTTDVSQLNQSFGYKMLRAFEGQLDAELSISADAGTTVSLHIKEYKTL